MIWNCAPPRGELGLSVSVCPPHDLVVLNELAESRHDEFELVDLENELPASLFV